MALKKQKYTHIPYNFMTDVRLSSALADELLIAAPETLLRSVSRAVRIEVVLQFVLYSYVIDDVMM